MPPSVVSLIESADIVDNREVLDKILRLVTIWKEDANDANGTMEYKILQPIISQLKF